MTHEALEPQDKPEHTGYGPDPGLRHLAELLGELDEFLRSGTDVTSRLTTFMQDRGHSNPGFAACNLIDDLSFTAYGLRRRIENPPPEHHYEDGSLAL